MWATGKVQGYLWNGIPNRFIDFPFPDLAGLVGGLLVTFMLQWLCRGLLQHLPKSFTVGEAAVVAQGVILFLFKSLALDLPRAVRGNNQPQDDAMAMACIVEWGVLLVVLLIGLMRLLGERVRNVFVFSTLTGLIGLAVTLTPITQPIPLLYVLEFLLTDPQKVSLSSTPSKCPK